MKVLGINASPRGKASQTLRLVIAVLDGAEVEGAKTELLDACDFDLEFCTACGTCYARGECIHPDDYGEILGKILDADGIVLGSPNYLDSVSAQLKILLDRMADLVHCQMLSGKYGCSVCTAGGSNEMEVVGYMNRVLTSFGAQVVGGAGVAFRGNPDAILPAERKAYDLGKELADAIRTKRSYPDQEAILKARREYFCQLVQANREKWTHEYEWWVQAGVIREGE